MGVFAPAALSILLPEEEIARFAVAVLSLGAGVAIAREVVADPSRWLRGFRFVAVSLLTTMGVAAVTVAIREQLAQRVAATRSTTVAGAPNVLLIVIDAGRADVLSSYGYSRATTPNLDALAREGTLFERAHSTAPWTLPSHITMFSGRYEIPDGDRTVRFRHPVGRSFPVLAESFRDAGYATAGFVANAYYTGRDTGLDRGVTTNRDYRRTLEEFMRSAPPGQAALARGLYKSRSLAKAWRVVSHGDFTVPTLPQHARKPATPLTDEFLEFVERRGDTPFFAFLNYCDVHKPLDPPAPFATKFAEVPNARDLYDGSYAYVDAEIGRRLSELRTRRALDDTIVVVTAVHGEMFREHGLFEHSSNLYLPVLHVPLIVRYPARVPAGRRISVPVSLRDLASTLTDLSRVVPAKPFPGLSLASHFDDDAGTSHSPVFAAVGRRVRSEPGLPYTRGALLTLLDDRWQFIRVVGVDADELDDYRDDPDQSRNLVDDPAIDSVASRLLGALDRLLEPGPEAALDIGVPASLTGSER